MIHDAFEEDQTNAFEIMSEFERAERAYQEYSMTEADKILAEIPDEEHEPSTQYPYM